MWNNHQDINIIVNMWLTYMKNVTILFVFGCIFHLNAMSQPCLPQGITFNHQYEITNFPINYPNCTEIGGRVPIDCSCMSSLTGLGSVISIGGGLSIKNCSSLTNLYGLGSLVKAS